MAEQTDFIGLIGTYTKGDSKGIYSFKLDTHNASITTVHVAGEIENPTYLTISKDNCYVYSVVKVGEDGGVAAFRLNYQSGKLAPINQQVSHGAAPCHVSVDSKNRLLFSANYHKGTVESYMLDPEDGSVRPPVSIVQHVGSGPDPRQEKAHTHFASLTPDGKFLTVAELGSDQLLSYKIGTDGKLSIVSSLELRAGSGPRHLAFHPNTQFAYLVTEFSSEVVALTYDSEVGSFKVIQTITMLPDDFQENNQASAIHISADGRFLYAANRGHNSIAVFQINGETGELSLIEHVSTYGDWPRDFVLDPTEKFVIVANQNSANLVLFSRDAATGKLTILQSNISVPDPVCVKFLHY